MSLMKHMLSIFILIGFVQCKQAASPIVRISYDYKKLDGRWLVTEAFRNNRPTTTINGALLDFQNNILTHNLYGTDKAFTYHTTDSSLITTEGQEYVIDFLEDSALILSTVIQSYRFRFSCRKTEIITSDSTSTEIQ